MEVGPTISGKGGEPSTQTRDMREGVHTRGGLTKGSGGVLEWGEVGKTENIFIAFVELRMIKTRFSLCTCCGLNSHGNKIATENGLVCNPEGGAHMGANKWHP